MATKRNLKKVLALTLAFASTGTMFSVANAAQFTDVKVTDNNASAINMLSDLTVLSGYKDGTFKPEDTITRAEATQVIANLLNGGLADTSRFAGGSNFADVPKGDWMDAPISFCVQNGIVVGTGKGKFEPNRQITDSEFVTMMTRALGYENKTHKLEYPYGHLSAAQAKGLLDDVSIETSSNCTRREVAQIAYNSLFADFARATAFDNNTHGSTAMRYTTLIEDKFKLERAFVENKKDDKLGTDSTNAWGFSWVITRDDCDTDNGYIATPIGEGGVEVGKPFTFKSNTDLSHLFGYKAELYIPTDKSKNNPQVKAVRIAEDQAVYEYNATMDDGKDDNKVTVGETTLTLKKDVAGTTEKSINKLDGAQYKLFDWDKDGVVDYVDVDTVNYYHVEYANDKGDSVRLESFDGKNDISTSMSKSTVKCPNGETVDEIVFESYEGIKAGHIVEVKENFSTEGGKHIVTYTLTQVEPKSMKLTKSSTKGTYEFDDKVYKVADDAFEDSVVSSNPEGLDFSRNGKLGDSYDLFLNRNGMILASSIGNAKSSYLMVLGYGEYGNGSSGIRREKAEVDVIFSNGKLNKSPIKIDTNAEIMLDGKSTNVWDGYTFKTGNGSDIVGSVFSYRMEGDEITELEEVADFASSAQPFSYDDRSMELSDKSDKVVADLSDTDSVFVVSAGWDDNLTSDNNGYIKSQYVDVVDAEKLPNITRSDANISRGVKGIDYAIYSKRGVDEVALLSVDKLDMLKGNDSTVALVTDIEAHVESSDKYEFIVHGNGEEIGSVKGVRNNDVIGTDYRDGGDLTWSDLRRVIGSKEDGAYCEIVKNKDGNIESITLMSKNGDKLEGRYHYVVRGVVSQVKGDSVTLETALGKDAVSIYHVNDSDKDVLGTFKTNDTKFFEIDTTPDIEFGAGAPIVQVPTSENIADGRYNVEASKGNSLIPSVFDGSDDCTGKADYFLADIAYEKNATNKAVAAYQYTDPVDCGGKYVAPEATMNAKFDYTPIEVGGTGKIVGEFELTNGAEVNSYKVIKKDDADATAVEDFNFDLQNGKTLTVTPKDSVKAGSYTLVVEDTNKKLKATYDFTVSAKANVPAPVAGASEVKVSFGMSQQDMVAAGFDSKSVSLSALKYIDDDIVSGKKNFEDDKSVKFELAGFTDGTLTFNVTEGRIQPYTAIKVTVTGKAAEAVGVDTMTIEVENIQPYDAKKQVLDEITRATTYEHSDGHKYSQPYSVTSEGADAIKVSIPFYGTIGTNQKKDLQHFIGALGEMKGTSISEITYSSNTYKWTKEEGGVDKFKHNSNILSNQIADAVNGQSTTQTQQLTINGITVTYELKKG